MPNSIKRTRPYGATTEPSVAAKRNRPAGSGMSGTTRGVHQNGHFDPWTPSAPILPGDSVRLEQMRSPAYNPDYCPSKSGYITSDPGQVSLTNTGLNHPDDKNAGARILDVGEINLDALDRSRFIHKPAEEEENKSGGFCESAKNFLHLQVPRIIKSNRAENKGKVEERAMLHNFVESFCSFCKTTKAKNGDDVDPEVALFTDYYENKDQLIKKKLMHPDNKPLLNYVLPVMTSVDEDDIDEVKGWLLDMAVVNLKALMQASNPTLVELVAKEKGVHTSEVWQRMRAFRKQALEQPIDTSKPGSPSITQKVREIYRDQLRYALEDYMVFLARSKKNKSLSDEMFKEIDKKAYKEIVRRAQIETVFRLEKEIGKIPDGGEIHYQSEHLCEALLLDYKITRHQAQQNCCLEDAEQNMLQRFREREEAAVEQAKNELTEADRDAVNEAELQAEIHKKVLDSWCYGVACDFPSLRKKGAITEESLKKFYERSRPRQG